MSDLAAKDAAYPPIASLAQRLHQANHTLYCEAVYNYVRGALRFKRDSELAQGIEGWGAIVEVLIRPADMLTMRPPEGDCDDFSMLVAALLLAGGVSCSFACVAADPLDPERFSHVYVVAHLAGGDVAIDASHGPVFGWEAPNNLGKRQLWRVPMNTGLGVENSYGVPTFSTTVTSQSAAATGDPAWLQIVNRGLDIVQGRFGTPENTYYRMPDGTIVSRGGAASGPAGTPLDIRATGSLTQQSGYFEGIGATVIFGFGALLAFILLMNLVRSKR